MVRHDYIRKYAHRKGLDDFLEQVFKVRIVLTVFKNADAIVRTIDYVVCDLTDIDSRFASHRESIPSCVSNLDKN